ncbi:hypothetical protein BDW71DRAFT_106514 [Aspergillus fruticulosus]
MTSNNPGTMKQNLGPGSWPTGVHAYPPRKGTLRTALVMGANRLPLGSRWPIRRSLLAIEALACWELAPKNASCPSFSRPAIALLPFQAVCSLIGFRCRGDLS